MLEAKLQMILWEVNLTEIMQHPARLRGKEKHDMVVMGNCNNNNNNYIRGLPLPSCIPPELETRGKRELPTLAPNSSCMLFSARKKLNPYSTMLGGTK